MSITKEHIEEKEQEKKEEFQKQISTLTDAQTKALANVNNVGRKLKLDTNVPNIGITLFNKISEISMGFKKVGLSMYVDYDKDYNIIESNFVGDAIRDDVLNKILQGIKSLEKYISTIKEIVDEKKEQQKTEIIEMNSIKKLFLNIRAYFNHDKTNEKIDYSTLDFSEANYYIEEYKRINNELWKYNLKDNLKDALVEKIKKEKNSVFKIKPKVSEIIDKNIRNDLEKLELSELIPEIEEELSKEIMTERINDEYNRLMDKLTRLNLMAQKNDKEKIIKTEPLEETAFAEVLKQNQKKDDKTLEKNDDEGR